MVRSKWSKQLNFSAEQQVTHHSISTMVLITSYVRYCTVSFLLCTGQSFCTVCTVLLITLSLHFNTMKLSKSTQLKVDLSIGAAIVGATLTASCYVTGLDPRKTSLYSDLADQGTRLLQSLDPENAVNSHNFEAQTACSGTKFCGTSSTNFITSVS